MNPQDQPTDPSAEQRPELQAEQPAIVTSAPGQVPSLPTPAPASPQSENFYRPDDADTAEPEFAGNPVPFPADVQMQGNGEEIVWTASEFVEHEKSPGWYLALGGISVVVMAVVFFVTRDWFTAVIVAVAAILFGVSASRPARHLQYAINDHGVGVGRRFHPYADFRSFSLVDEGSMHSILLMPLKRFMPPISLYFDPADEDRISDVLAAHLPFAEHQHELTDRLMRRIRF